MLLYSILQSHAPANHSFSRRRFGVRNLLSLAPSSPLTIHSQLRPRHCRLLHDPQILHRQDSPFEPSRKRWRLEQEDGGYCTVHNLERCLMMPWRPSFSCDCVKWHITFQIGKLNHSGFGPATSSPSSPCIGSIGPSASPSVAGCLSSSLIACCANHPSYTNISIKPHA
jgi:hypothetical protein